MSEHQCEIVKFIPEGKNNTHYIAVCSCQRWRSSPYRSKGDAETKALAHTIHGDEQNRARAALDRRTPKINTELGWYRDQAMDPLNNEQDREMWKRLADELEARIEAGDGSEQATLF